MSLEELSEPFRKSAVIASQLGFRYLWIHDLYANLSADPLSEASYLTLALVHTYAACTVSAAESPGLLSHINPRHDDCPLVFKFPWAGGKPSAITARAPITQEVGSGGISMLFEDCVDGHPPNRQHRFFQERLLLHRILFVCENDTLFFDCNTLRATSCHPDGKPYFPPPPSDNREFTCTTTSRNLQLEQARF